MGDFMPYIDIDTIDRAIIREPMRYGRLTNAELSGRVNLSPSACLRRVKLMEEVGLIAGYVILLDPVLAGIRGVAFVMVTLDQQGRAARDRFEAAAARFREVLECYLLAGSADYMVRVAYRDSVDFERIDTDLLTQLPGVSRLQSPLALCTVKKTTALPV